MTTTEGPSTAEVAESITDLAEYKLHVLRVALAAKRDNSWCDEGFRRAMEALAIPAIVEVQGKLRPSADKLTACDPAEGCHTCYEYSFALADGTVITPLDF